MSAAPAATGKKPAGRARKAPDPVKSWASYLRRYRPGLQGYVLEQLTATYGPQTWESRLDPTSELVLTILTQNTADVNAEKAYEALRGLPQRPGARGAQARDRLGGRGPVDRPAPGLDGRRERTPPAARRRHPAGRAAPQKAPRIQATLRHIREQRGDYSLAFLGEMPAIEARDWLTAIDGIGKKTASIVLAFCFGAPVMAVDRHVERVSKRIGLIPAKATADQAHDLFLGILEPDEMYAAHVLLIHHGRAICHAQNPKHDLCPVRDRCRAVHPRVS